MKQLARRVLHVGIGLLSYIGATEQAAADASTKLRLLQTHVLCEFMGLGAVGTVPFNFPGSNRQATARYRADLNSGIVEDLLVAGTNRFAPALLGGDLGAPFAHSDGKLYFIFGDSWFESPARVAGCSTGSDGCVPTVENDDVLANAERYVPTSSSKCLALDTPRATSTDDVQPLTWDGPANSGGHALGRAVPGPGFSTGRYMFVLTSAPAPSCGATQHDCAAANGIVGDVCKSDPNGEYRCYFGECADGPNSPCGLRFNPSKLLVRTHDSDFTEPTVGVHITTDRVFAGYRGHFSALAFYSEVDFASGSGRVWVLGRDSFWGTPGLELNPYLMYHPVENGQLGEPLFYAGTSENHAIFSTNSADGVPLFKESANLTQHNSLVFEPELAGGTWLMLYGGHAQSAVRAGVELFVHPVTDDIFYSRDAGIYMRWAQTPWGPWSDPITVFNPFVLGQGGYCEQMHFDDPQHKTGFECPASAAARNNDLNRVPGLGSGAEYGAAIVPGATEIKEDSVSVRWLVSTYNPYRVLLQESVLSVVR